MLGMASFAQAIFAWGTPCFLFKTVIEVATIVITDCGHDLFDGHGALG